MRGSCGPKCPSRLPRRRKPTMAGRTIDVDGETWEVFPSGRMTVYDKDEFSVTFQQGTGPSRRRRFTRFAPVGSRRDRKSTRLNSSHSQISYAVFCLKKNNTLPSSTTGLIFSLPVRLLAGTTIPLRQGYPHMIIPNLSVLLVPAVSLPWSYPATQGIQ